MEPAVCSTNQNPFPAMFEDLPCCFYIVQAQEPFSLLYANRETLRLFDCQNLEEFRHHICNDGRNVVAIDDQPRFIEEFQRELTERQGHFAHVPAHLFTRENRIRYADISGRKVDTEIWGEVIYCTLQEIDVPQKGQRIDRDIRDYVTQHLDEALENHWIQVYYQPIIRTLTGKLCGMESLARWVDPQVGFLSPTSFVPILEQVRLIHRLDTYVLEEVCRMLRQRMDGNLPITPISFNLSKYDFDNMDVFAVVETIRKKYSLPRDFLHIEITESVLAQNAQEVHQTIGRLRKEGYEVWLDDFGSGYSSLNVLKDYRLDLIKLDMGFLRNFTEVSRSIVSSVIIMAKRLGIKTLVEGVETKEQADYLASIGCGRQQGYYYGKPQPLAGVLAHMEAEGRTTEPRKWFHFYDMASMSIHQTDRTSALYDMDETGHIHFIYTNQAYREEIRKMGYSLENIEKNINQPKKTEGTRTFRTYIELSRKSHQLETYYYIDGGDYISVRVRVICEMNRHLLIHTEFQNISQSNSRLQQNKLDVNLRYLYDLFEDVYLVSPQEDTIEHLYANNNSSHSLFQGKSQGLQETLQQFTQQRVYEEDRANYLAFADLDTLNQRISQNPSGSISCFFRSQDNHGNYKWRECMAIPLYNVQHPLLLVATRTIDNPVTVTAVSRGTADSLPALLWANFKKNTRLNYFWKDKERRFLGASQSFLRHYDFQSEKEIIGKTDEDMNWHIDNSPYRNDELDVLHQGKTIENASGECIVKGILHHITCYKWPIYQDGQIIGLMGVFFDADQLYHELRKKLSDPFTDPISGLQNRQGFLNDLITYQETWDIDHQPYCLIMLESRFDEYMKKSYELPLLRKLIRQESQIIQEMAGTDSTISRVFNSTFTILRREKTPEESEALARKIQRRLQDIHQVDGNPVTITFHWSIVHSTDSLLRKDSSKKVRRFYRLAMKRLRNGDR
ncbi:EAL domain-containing protein [uncultured Megasphaera sp.]|uniref:bifunctional diguanylate cyclase/phosphodiesterase n=1 Tax=uncultured Megasphaera sp. TaxID=165188 RepID=UPI00262CDBEB|nr:EAL domain-containing protein [uncultured Megasphaera sp.]